MKELQQIWDEMTLKSDKGDVHSYLPVYEDVLASYRETANHVLEIGLFNGASLLLWEQYFTKAMVHGIDCDEQPHGGLADLRDMIQSGRHNIYITDATDAAKINLHFGTIKWDVVIEDAAHNIEQQVQLFNIFKGRMNKGGLYIIEDVQDLDKDRWIFEAMSGNFTVEILDRREVNGRYDDVLVVIKFN